LELIRQYTTIHLENQSFAYFPNGAVRPRMISHIEDLVDVYLETPKNLREYTPEMEREAIEAIRIENRLERERRNTIAEQHRIMEENQRQQYRQQKLREIQTKERMLENYIKRLEKKITLCDIGMALCCVLVVLSAILVLFDVFEYPYGTLLLAPQFFIVFKKKKIMDAKIKANIDQYEVNLERMSLVTGT